MRRRLAAVLLAFAATAGATTPIAPRRDLGPDEGRGGHTLARHVGRSDAELRERLRRERRLSTASTYTDRRLAEETVGIALAREKSRVAAWSARRGPRPNLVLDFDGRGRPPAGRALRRGEGEPRVCYDASVVLKWDETRGDYFVLTSYPEPPR